MMLVQASLAWTIVADGTGCAIGSTYSGKPRITLSLIALEQVPDTFAVAIEGDGWTIVDGGKYPTTLTFDETPVQTTATGLATKPPAKSAGLVIRVNGTSLAAFAAGRSLGITVKGTEITRLSLAGSADAVASLRNCAAKLPAWVTARRTAEALAKQRAMDPFASIAPDGPPKDPDPTKWVSSDDYPASALNAQEQGTVGFRYSVNVQGRIEKCVITKSSGSTVLDRTTCRLLTSRGRYRPGAREISGEIAWTLPNR